MTITLDKPQTHEKLTSAGHGQDERLPAEHHWTIDAYYRAINAGVFKEPERLELIQGRIIENMTMNPPHRAMRTRLGRRLRTALENRFFVVEECSVRLASDSEPVPDVLVLEGNESDYDERHPTQDDVALLVEVADTSVSYDTGGKAVQYAQAGIEDYWVALVNEEAILVHREPTLEGYRAVTWLAGTDPISLLASPEVTWTVEALLRREV